MGYLRARSNTEIKLEQLKRDRRSEAMGKAARGAKVVHWKKAGTKELAQEELDEFFPAKEER